MSIYISSDHRGFDLKTEIVKYLESFKLIDLGPEKYNKDDDYPLFAHLLANKVSENVDNRGILICDTGIGMDITANKHKGIRAAICIDEFFAYRARLHNNANVLVLSAEYNKDNYKGVIDKFFSTDFSSEERHKRRVDEIDIL